MDKNKNIIVIGGGAAGFFAAINLAEKNRNYTITLLEKTNKLLSKVKVSGGGRCNVTNNCFENSELIKNYPRGGKELQQVFARFSVKETIDWFEDHGVALKTEEDGRIFPQSDDSQTIIDCFMKLVKKYSIHVITSCEVHSIRKNENSFQLNTSQGEMNADSVIVALGGHPKSGAYSLLKNLGHTIIEPIPSLFTLNFPNEKIKKELMGISVPNAEIMLAKGKYKYQGPVLITHWGLSGPAVLKLSAFAAKELYERDYTTEITVNWAYPLNQNQIELEIKRTKNAKQKSKPASTPLFSLPKRLWEFFCDQSGIDNSKTWAEISAKSLNQLCELIARSIYQMEGKTTFKEEFVTCGGVDLKEIDMKRMESKIVPGLYFCGEVINVDGITGGFNFQNAWSTAWICANAII